MSIFDTIGQILNSVTNPKPQAPNPLASFNLGKVADTVQGMIAPLAQQFQNLPQPQYQQPQQPRLNPQEFISNAMQDISSRFNLAIPQPKQPTDIQSKVSSLLKSIEPTIQQARVNFDPYSQKPNFATNISQQAYTFLNPLTKPAQVPTGYEVSQFMQQFDDQEGKAAWKKSMAYTPDGKGRLIPPKLSPREQELASRYMISTFNPMLSMQTKTAKAAQVLTKNTGLVDDLFNGVRSKINNIYTATLDRFHPLSSIAHKAGEDQAMRNALTGYYGTGSIGKFHTDFELSPILKSVDVNELRQAAIAMRDAELTARGIKGSNTSALTDLITRGEVRPEIGVALKKLYAYQDNLVQEYLVKTGIMSDKAFTAMKSKNQFYVPFKRVMDQVDEYLGVPPTRGAGSVGSQNVIKGIKGSDKQIIDPLQSIIENTYKIVSLGQRQKVAQTLVSLKNDLPLGMIERAKGYVSPNNAISVFESGKTVKYKVPSEVAIAAKGLTEEGMNTIIKILAAPTRVFRATATGVNPEFALPNTFRDLQSAFVNAGLNPLKFVSGLAHYMKRDDVYQEFLKSGGMTSRLSLDKPFLEQSVKDLTGQAKALRIVDPRRLFKTLGAIGQASEQPTRIAAFQKAYNAAIKKGLPIEEARARGAYAAQESTVNFARRGNATSAANAIYAFMNARAQGVDRLVRSVKSDPIGTTFRIGLITVAPALALHQYNKQFQSYNDPRVVPDYVKENNFVMMLSDQPIDAVGGAQYITIPKGDVGKLANPLEQFLSMAEGKGGDVAKSLRGVLTAFSPVQNVGDLIPTALRPAIENAANYNFFYDKPIISESKKNYPAPYQANKSTPAIYKEAGRVFSQSPAMIENLSRGYLTGFARIGEMMTRPLAAEDVYSGQDINQAPIIRRFLGGAVRTEEDQQLNEYFEQKGLLNKVQDIKTGIKYGNIPLDAGVKEIEKLMQENNEQQQQQSPSSQGSYFAPKAADAAETSEEPKKSVQETMREQIQEDLARATVASTGKAMEVNGKYIYFDTSSGETRAVPLDRKIEIPQLTGNTELDKLKISQLASDYTTKINDMVTLYDLGKVTAEEAEAQIAKLKEDQKLVRDYGKTIGSSGKISKSKLPKPKMPSLKLLKLKTPKAPKIKAITFKPLKPIKVATSKELLRRVAMKLGKGQA